MSLVAWALASPVGASPDDDFHLASIWCGHGAVNDECQPGETDADRLLSSAFSQSNCYALISSQSAGCQGSNLSFDPNQIGYSDRGNFRSDYPPVFYFTQSLLATNNLGGSVIGMRLLNAGMLVGLLGLTFSLISARIRLAALWGLLVTASPLVLFIVPSTNPSSWAVISIAGLWPALLGFFETTGKKRVALGALAVLFTIIGAGARADAAVYAGIAVVAVAVLEWRRNRALTSSLWLLGLIVLIALVFFGMAHQSGAAAGGVGGSGDDKKSLGYLIAANAVGLPSLWSGALGTWGLGWLDTEMPPIVWVLSTGIYFAAVLIGLGRSWRRKSIVLSLVFAILCLFPYYLLIQSNAVVGDYIQPRYILPIMILLAGFALLGRPNESFVLTSGQRLVISTAIFLSYTFALHTNMQRYISGADKPGWNLNDNLQWWWPAAPSPMVIWIFGVLAFGMFLIIINLRAMTRTQTNAD